MCIVYDIVLIVSEERITSRTWLLQPGEFLFLLAASGMSRDEAIRRETCRAITADYVRKSLLLY